MPTPLTKWLNAPDVVNATPSPESANVSLDTLVRLAKEVSFVTCFLLVKQIPHPSHFLQPCASTTALDMVPAKLSSALPLRASPTMPICTTPMTVNSNMAASATADTEALIALKSTAPLVLMYSELMAELKVWIALAVVSVTTALDCVNASADTSVSVVNSKVLSSNFLV